MSDYDTDVLVWSERQAELLRRVAAGEQINDQVDWPNIIDEVETVGRSERSALRSHISTVLEHLIKLQASPATDPRNGWKVSIDHARADIARDLADSPSLGRLVAGLITEETRRAGKLVALSLERFGEQPRTEIENLTFTEEQVLDLWFPEDPTSR
jgi:Domain of unknown function DUF29